jgi:hypothetical protein
MTFGTKLKLKNWVNRLWSKRSFDFSPPLHYIRLQFFLNQILVGTSAAESMNAAANIFLGQVKAL